MRVFYKTLIRVNYDPAKAGWEQEYNFEAEVDGLVTVMNKTNGSDIHQVNGVLFYIFLQVFSLTDPCAANEAYRRPH